MKLTGVVGFFKVCTYLLIFLCLGGTALADTVATPQITPSDTGPLTLTYQPSVNIICNTPGATIRYTTNNVDPNQYSAIYTVPFNVSTYTTVKAMAFKDGFTPSSIASQSYIIRVGQPSFNSPGGTYGDGETKTVQITSATQGATIYYITDYDGTNAPGPGNGTEYLSSMTITTPTIITARGYKANHNNSNIISATYNFKVSQPTFDPPAQSYSSIQYVELSSTSSGASIYYTTNGTTPVPPDIDDTGNGLPYTGPIKVRETQTIKAIAYKDGFVDSNVISAQYTLPASVAIPQFSVSGGTYMTPQYLTLSCQTSGATIYYSTSLDLASNDEPTSASNLYTGPIPVFHNQIIKAVAYKGGLIESLIESASYKIGKTVGAGFGHSMSIRSNNTLKTWGDNLWGQLGNGTQADEVSPIPISGMNNIFYCGSDGAASFTVTTDGKIYSWGYNAYGQLGHSGSYYPMFVVDDDGTFEDVVSASLGYAASTAVKSDGSIWAWGSQAWGILGDRQSSSQTPVEIVDDNGLSFNNMVSVSGFEWSALALANDGTVWAWGKNDMGNLGDGTTDSNNHPIPTQVPNLTGVIAISKGRYHNLALKADGTVWSWGNNMYGQLGNGTTTTSYVPVQVSNLTNVVAIFAFWETSFAIKNDGTLWGWGNNSGGQIGDGTTTSKTTPVQVSNLTNVKAIASGGNHSIAIDANGDVWAWGDNSEGQLGDGTTTTWPVKSVPQAVNGL